MDQILKILNGDSSPDTEMPNHFNSSNKQALECPQKPRGAEGRNTVFLFRPSKKYQKFNF